MVVVHSPTQTVGDPAFQATVAAVERELERRPGASATSCRPGRASRSPPTATPPSSRPGPPATPTRWSAPPTSSRVRWPALGRDDVEVDLTGASGMWSDFNDANKTRDARSELISWPVTLAIMVLAFGSLVAAGCR